MSNRGKLYIIPSVISEGTQQDVISNQTRAILPSVRFFLAEDVRTARRFLASLGIYESVEPLQFQVLNKNTPDTELPGLLQPLHEGNNMGVISESGCPGVADPGSMAVYFAHQNGIQVVPLVGPSSLLLALMGAGLNGQQFAFHGYLPIKAKEAAHLIKELERESKAKSQTQIFIETPYRNNSIFDLLIKNLQPETRLSVALDLTGKQESIQTQSVKKWQSVKTNWPKEPAVFLFLA